MLEHRVLAPDRVEASETVEQRAIQVAGAASYFSESRYSSLPARRGSFS